MKDMFVVGKRLLIVRSQTESRECGVGPEEVFANLSSKLCGDTSAAGRPVTTSLVVPSLFFTPRAKYHEWYVTNKSPAFIL
jgi:hypothetical protein